jgi:hypothetical protein
MLGIWYRLRNRPDWSRYRRYTLGTMIVGVVFGIAMVPFVQGPHAGLLERISVGLIIQWYAGTGLLVMLASRDRV